jgi:putative membrane protein
MKNNPYENFTKKELILRDHLAIDRTTMANERTILAYIRTAFAVIAAGAALIHFFEDLKIKSIGGLMIISGILIAVFGVYRFRLMQNSIRKVERS